MNPQPIELAKDADLRGAPAALRRAAAEAERIAQQTGTRLITVESSEAGDNRKIAVEIVDDRGIESLKVISLD